MEFEITCDCGWSCRGSEEEVVAATISHGQSTHQIELSPEQAREAARPVEVTAKRDG
jgi:predicted small metal-binding protein